MGMGRGTGNAYRTIFKATDNLQQQKAAQNGTDQERQKQPKCIYTSSRYMITVVFLASEYR